MADSQEIYIRNPLAVLNVDLCGMRAPEAFKGSSTVDPEGGGASSRSAGDRKVNSSLSKVIVTLANCLVIPLSQSQWHC